MPNTHSSRLPALETYAFALLFLGTALIGCSRQASRTKAARSDQVSSLQDDAEAKIAAEQQAEQSRRIWRRSYLRRQLKNDELLLKTAELEQDIAEREGRQPSEGAVVRARAYIRSDKFAIENDDSFDELEHNLEVTGAPPEAIAKDSKFRQEFDDVRDQIDEKIRAAKTTKEVNRLSAELAHALRDKYTEFIDETEADMHRLEEQVRRTQGRQKSTDAPVVK